MRPLRALIEKHRKLALLLVVLAFCVKAIVPAGFMLSASKQTFLTVTICSDGIGEHATMKLAIPVKAQTGGEEGGVKQGEHCAFSGLAHSALGGADAILLAIAFAVIVMLGLAPATIPAPRRPVRLRPPLRGPPAFV